MKWKKYRLILLSLFLVVWSVEATAQTVTDMPEPRMQAVPPPPGLPIDAGISALLAAGLGLGIYHFRSKK